MGTLVAAQARLEGRQVGGRLVNQKTGIYRSDTCGELFEVWGVGRSIRGKLRGEWLGRK